jgi:hypothetical protein
MTSDGANVSKPVAQVSAESRKEPRFDPNASRRGAARRRVRLRFERIGDAHLTAQRVTFAHGIKARKLCRISKEHDCREVRDLCRHEPLSLGLGEVFGIHSLVGAEPEISREHAGSLALDARLHAVDEEPDRRDRSHGHRERDHEHGQAAGT